MRRAWVECFHRGLHCTRGSGAHRSMGAPSVGIFVAFTSGRCHSARRRLLWCSCAPSCTCAGSAWLLGVEISSSLFEVVCPCPRDAQGIGVACVKLWVSPIVARMGPPPRRSQRRMHRQQRQEMRRTWQGGRLWKWRRLVLASEPFSMPPASDRPLPAAAPPMGPDAGGSDAGSPIERPGRSRRQLHHL